MRNLRMRVSGTSDAVVVSFPKSGRTWLRFMLDQIGIPVRYTHAGSDHVLRKNFDELTLPQAEFARKRVLFMLRDPRDTAVSGYFQATRRIHCFSGSMQDFLRDPRHGLEKIIRFNLMWLDAGADCKDFAVLQYQDLHADAPSEFARAAAFLCNRILSEGEIERAVEAGKFENMHALELSGKGGDTYGDILSPKDPNDPDSFKVRRGKIGGWRDYFTPEDEIWAEDLIARYDYAKVEQADRD